MKEFLHEIQQMLKSMGIEYHKTKEKIDGNNHFIEITIDDIYRRCLMPIIKEKLKSIPSGLGITFNFEVKR